MNKEQRGKVQQVTSLPDGTSAGTQLALFTGQQILMVSYTKWKESPCAQKGPISPYHNSIDNTLMTAM